jgi:hypothetical protein
MNKRNGIREMMIVPAKEGSESSDGACKAVKLRM